MRYTIVSWRARAAIRTESSFQRLFIELLVQNHKKKILSTSLACFSLLAFPSKRSTLHINLPKLLQKKNSQNFQKFFYVISQAAAQTLSQFFFSHSNLD